MKRPREVIKPRWGVYALRRKAERISSVNAKNEKEALQRALKECEIPERERFTFAAIRTSGLVSPLRAKLCPEAKQSNRWNERKKSWPMSWLLPRLSQSVLAFDFHGTGFQLFAKGI